MESFSGFIFSCFILQPYHVADIPQYVFLSAQWGNEIFLKLHMFFFLHIFGLDHKSCGIFSAAGDPKKYHAGGNLSLKYIQFVNLSATIRLKGR